MWHTVVFSWWLNIYSVHITDISPFVAQIFPHVHCTVCYPTPGNQNPPLELGTKKMLYFSFSWIFSTKIFSFLQKCDKSRIQFKFVTLFSQTYFHKVAPILALPKPSILPTLSLPLLLSLPPPFRNPRILSLSAEIIYKLRVRIFSLLRYIPVAGKKCAKLIYFKVAR